MEDVTCPVQQRLPPACSIERVTKPDATTAAVNCCANSAVAGRSFAWPMARALLPWLPGTMRQMGELRLV
jgi:hypothetical protein